MIAIGRLHNGLITFRYHNIHEAREKWKQIATHSGWRWPVCHDMFVFDTREVATGTRQPTLRRGGEYQLSDHFLS